MGKKGAVSILSIVMATTAMANDCSVLSSENCSSVVTILANQVLVDYNTYYHFKGIPYLVTGLGISAVFANAEFDLIAREEWQTRLRGRASNDFFAKVDDFSEVSQYTIFIPLYLLSMWLGKEYPESEGTVFIGSWGNHSLRALLLGAPQQALFTALLGSSRPEKNHPKWAPFQYGRAVSGHAFYGALPLINLAKVVEDPYLKSASYVLSTLPAFARINNDKHYLSQAFLGWWLAYSATKIVWEADKIPSKYCFDWHIIPSFKTIYLTANLKF